MIMGRMIQPRQHSSGLKSSAKTQVTPIQINFHQPWSSLGRSTIQVAGLVDEFD